MRVHAMHECIQRKQNLEAEETSVRSCSPQPRCGVTNTEHTILDGTLHHMEEVGRRHALILDDSGCTETTSLKVLLLFSLLG